MFKNFPFHRVNWKTSSFLILTFFGALILTPWYLIKYDLPAIQWVMFAFYFVATTMSITLGYHRLFSHLSFKAKWPVKLFTLCFGAASFENSCLSWASDHRHHHKHVDGDGDPYDINKGFWYAHIGWLLFKLDPMPIMNNVADLKRDKLVMWQEKWVHLIGFVIGFIVPTLIGYAIGGSSGALGAFIITGLLRTVLVQHCTFFINSLCHTIGKRPYDSRTSARDSAIMAIFTCGEGYHNYHHSFQHDYRNGVKPWQLDPTKWMIWTLSKVGLATGLRTVPDEKILLAQMREAQRLIETKRTKLQEQEEHPLRDRAEEIIDTLSDRLAESYSSVEEAISNKASLSKAALLEIQQEIRDVVKSLSKEIKRANPKRARS